mgnify:FL=1
MAIVGYEQDQVISPHKNTTDEQSVPIYWAYNHHYVAWLKGKDATMVRTDQFSSKSGASMGGHPLWQHAVTLDDPNPSSTIPTSQFFSEGNGGESRKSFHAYPAGYAQLLESPTHFVITPMQIDTWNRNTSYGDPFKPGPESKRSGAPITGPDAIYSGHLECPCTDRIVKTTVHTYATQTTGVCATPAASADACFAAVANELGGHSLQSLRDTAVVDPKCPALSANVTATQCSGMLPYTAAKTSEACRAQCCANPATCDTWLFGSGSGSSGASGCYLAAGACKAMVGPSPEWNGGTSLPVPGKATVGKNVTVSEPSLPRGCSFAPNNGSTTVYTATFNTLASSKTPCGASSGTSILAGSMTSLGLTLGLKLDPTHSASGLATLTLIGPSDVWYGFGLGAQTMSQTPNAIIVLGNGTVIERKLANQNAGSSLSPAELTIVSNTVDAKAGTRTVVVTRPFKGATADHFTFDPTHSQISYINAIGKGPDFAYHKTRAAAILSLLAEGGNTCMCDEGEKHFIHSDVNQSPEPFSKNCRPEPEGDLLQLHNPTCTLDAYRGGLKCCKSRNILLDADQNPWNTLDDLLVYYMKFRFYFEEYVPAPEPATKPWEASHQDLLRFFKQTEADAGEYDVVKAAKGTPPSDTIYQITAHFQVRLFFSFFSCCRLAHSLSLSFALSRSLALSQTHNGVSECDKRSSPHCAGNVTGGINLVYASHHCHAPSCIKAELWNADTGALICRQVPHYGASKAATPGNPYDEIGYAAIPPCLFSDTPGDGLEPTPFLAYNQNLTAIKWNNNTYDHFGEMAMWQMRGYASYV